CFRSALTQAPRTWGWTRRRGVLLSDRDAGPTHVGMDRSGAAGQVCPVGRPHARGDGPRPVVREAMIPAQAPRTWGWTVTVGSRTWRSAAGPTHVGMDRDRRFADMAVRR